MLEVVGILIATLLTFIGVMFIDKKKEKKEREEREEVLRKVQERQQDMAWKALMGGLRDEQKSTDNPNEHNFNK